MKSIISAGVLAGTLALAATSVLADTIQNVNFSFSDPTNGNLTATGTLVVNLTTGQALSGSGSLYSSLFVEADGVTQLGLQTMTLVTSSNRGLNNQDALGGFLWTDSDGTNLLADTAFSLTAPYVDSDGLLFAVGIPTGDGHYGSFNFYFNNNGGVLGDFLGHGGPAGHGQVWSGASAGTLTVETVPVPAAAWLFGSGLVALSGAGRKRKAA